MTSCPKDLLMFHELEIMTKFCVRYVHGILNIWMSCFKQNVYESWSLKFGNKTKHYTFIIYFILGPVLSKKGEMKVCHIFWWTHYSIKSELIYDTQTSLQGMSKSFFFLILAERINWIDTVFASINYQLTMFNFQNNKTRWSMNFDPILKSFFLNEAIQDPKMSPNATSI